MILHKHKVVVGSLLLFFGCLCTAQVGIKTVPIKNVDPSSGEKMYVTYCGACHGTDGKGTGPAATAMKALPTDLTTLAKRNNGKFPALHVQQTIRGDTAMPAAHGTKDMPVWGNLFSSLTRGDTITQAEVEQRVVNLTTYVQLLQQR
ncbi:MAG: c-type cytochrome [Terriglobales bacterium]